MLNEVDYIKERDSLEELFKNSGSEMIKREIDINLYRMKLLAIQTDILIELFIKKGKEEKTDF